MESLVLDGKLKNITWKICKKCYYYVVEENTTKLWKQCWSVSDLASTYLGGWRATRQNVKTYKTETK